MNVFLWGLVLFLVVYQLKHVLADYLLQGQWMLRKFEDGWTWVLPLTAHSAVHAFATFWLVRLFTWSPGGWGWCFLMAGPDFVLHFVMDRLKAGPKWLGRYKPLTSSEFIQCKFVIATTPPDSPERIDRARRLIKENKFFWWALGLDQMVHHLTHYLVVFLTVARW